MISFTDVRSTLACTTYGMHEALVTARSFPATADRDGQAVDEVGGDLDRVDHPSLRVARMRVEAVEGDRHRVGREALDLDLAPAAAVHRVGAARAEACDVEVLRAAPDLFVRRERDADRAVRNLGMRDEIGGRRHDLGHAGLVVGAEQRRARRGDDVVAHLLGERAGCPRSRSTAVGSSGRTRSRPS